MGDRSLAEEKAALRRRMRALRAAIPDRERRRRSRSAVDRLLVMPEAQAARSVFVFLSFGTEIVTDGIVTALAERGRRALVPFVDAGGMHAAAYRPGDPLAATGFGPLQPREPVPVDPSSIDLVVAPGLAFDRAGHRLGYGGGYYDGFLRLSGLRAFAIGFGFHPQVIGSVPHDDHDGTLDAIVTDRETIRVEPPAAGADRESGGPAA